MEGAPFLGWFGIGTDTVIPPVTFAFREVRRQFHMETALPVVLLLIPLPGPLPSAELMGFEPSILIGIGAVALRIELKDDGTTVLILPVSRQDRTVIRRKITRDGRTRE
jgi:hypothetical protein